MVRAIGGQSSGTGSAGGPIAVAKVLPRRGRAFFWGFAFAFRPKNSVFEPLQIADIPLVMRFLPV
jgi:hypothetical protein